MRDIIRPQLTPPSNILKSNGGSLTNMADGRMSMGLDKFAECMAREGALSMIIKQFRAIVQRDKDMPAVAFQNNRELNRWGDIKCYDHTRVMLEPPEKDYIHANYVDGFECQHKFICAQGPLSQTINDFWRMIWQEEVLVMVALTKLGGSKCQLYFPSEQGATDIYGEITVENRGVQNINNAYDASALKVTKGDEIRRVLQLTYYAWPDKGTPYSSTTLLNFMEQMNYNLEQLKQEAHNKEWLTKRPNNKTKPIVVHCSAGVGRTGTLVAMDILARRLDTTNHRPEGAQVDIVGTVLKLREQRAAMVQRPEQYVFLHMVMIEYALRKQYLDPDKVNVKPFLISTSNSLRTNPQPDR